MLITDTPCMVRPIKLKSCPHILENGGALPRLEAETEDNITGTEGTNIGQRGVGSGEGKRGKVSIPALADMGVHTKSIAPHEPTTPSPDARGNAVANVYDLFRRASPSPPLQHGVDFGNLLDVAAKKSQSGCAVRFRELVVSSWTILHEHGLYFLTLYEAAVIIMECMVCLLYTSPSPRDKRQSRMPSSA